MPPELEQMRDIAYLYGIKAWPPGDMFWYLLTGLGVISVSIAVSIFVYKRYLKSEKYLTREYLDDLLFSFDVTPERSIKLYAEELRRIVIKKYGRNDAASLIDNEWVTWLNTNEVGNINWDKYADTILNAPYRKPGIKVNKISKTEFKKLIKALKRCV